MNAIQLIRERVTDTWKEATPLWNLHFIQPQTITKDNPLLTLFLDRFAKIKELTDLDPSCCVRETVCGLEGKLLSVEQGILRMLGTIRKHRTGWMKFLFQYDYTLRWVGAAVGAAMPGPIPPCLREYLYRSDQSIDQIQRGQFSSQPDQSTIRIDPEAKISTEQIGDYSVIGEARIAERVRIGCSVFIGNNVTIDPGASVESYAYIENDVSIGEDAEVEEGGWVKSGVRLPRMAIVGTYNTIVPGLGEMLFRVS